MVSPIIELLGMAMVLVIIALLKSSINGHLRDMYNWAREGSQDVENTNEAVPRIESKVEQVYSTTERIERKTDNNSNKITNIEEAIAIIHEDDESVNKEELKEKLDIDQLDTDIKHD